MAWKKILMHIVYSCITTQFLLPLLHVLALK